MSSTLVILLVGGCVASSCALLGCFLVLRKMALMGDAISHAVLPGIVIAFLLAGDRSTLPMVIGASILGVITVFLVEIGTRSRRLQEDASIGVVFPALFSIGVILISRYAGQVDLDLECVLYGEIAYTPLDLLYWGDRTLGPRALWINGSILIAVLAFLFVFYKELKISTFDPALAAALGFSPVLIHYLLMTMLSITIVGAFESVGAILVVAMLVVPAATAYLLTERLATMLLLSTALGLASSTLGYFLARSLDASIAGSMAVVAGAFFATAFLFSPTHGLVAKAARHRRLGLGMAEQLLMLHIGQSSEPESGQMSPGCEIDTLERRFNWRPSKLQKVAKRLERQGWLDRVQEGRLRLTASGAEALERTGQAPLTHALQAED